MSKLLDLLPTFEFTVYELSLGGVANEHKVEAAYFQESGSYTLFKDDVHVVVAAFKTDLVSQVRRSEDPLVD